MPFSKTRNDIVHMDAYHRDPKRESFKPLLSQIAEDFLAEGFEDVGPQITKLTIKDDALTNYIDEFICYYYDSALNRVGTGAAGIGWGLEGTAVFPTPEELISNPEIEYSRLSPTSTSVKLSDISKVNEEPCVAI